MNKLFVHILALYYKLKTNVWYKVIMGELGYHCCIFSPIKIERPKTLDISNNVYIQKYGWFYSVNEDSIVIIDSGTQIGHFFHCVSKNTVHIGKKVLIADKVFISDCTHIYQDINNPIIDQGVEAIKPVHIDDGSWIGENVCILGASIGKNCVIGANAVVTKDIPDYSVAVGNPAKVIKRFNPEANSWEKIDE